MILPRLELLPAPAPGLEMCTGDWFRWRVTMEGESNRVRHNSPPKAQQLQATPESPALTLARC